MCRQAAALSRPAQRGKGGGGGQAVRTLEGGGNALIVARQRLDRLAMAVGDGSEVSWNGCAIAFQRRKRNLQGRDQGTGFVKPMRLQCGTGLSAMYRGTLAAGKWGFCSS